MSLVRIALHARTWLIIGKENRIIMNELGQLGKHPTPLELGLKQEYEQEEGLFLPACILRRMVSSREICFIFYSTVFVDTHLLPENLFSIFCRENFCSSFSTHFGYYFGKDHDEE